MAKRFRAVSLFCACVVAAVAAAAANDGDSSFASVDSLFDQAGVLEARFAERCVDQRSAAAASFAERVRSINAEVDKEAGPRPPSFIRYPPDVEAAVCDAGRSFSELAQTLADAGLQDRVVQYYSCAAFSRRDASVCDAIKSVRRNLSHQQPWGVPIAPLDVSCREFFHQFRLSRALIAQDAAAVQVCRRGCAEEGIGLVLGTDRPVRGDAPACETLCALALKHRNEPSVFCGEALALASVKSSSWAVQSCSTESWQDQRFSKLVGLGPFPTEQMLRLLRDPEHPDCADGEPCYYFDDVNEHVLDYAAFRKAWGAGDKNLCAESGICRVMMGAGPRACQPYADQALGKVCDGKTKAQRTEVWARRREKLEEEKKSLARGIIERYNGDCAQTRAQLEALDEKIGITLGGIPADLPGRDLRGKKLAAAYHRHRDLAEKGMPVEWPGR